MGGKIIQMQAIETLVSAEPFILLLSLAALTWLFYKFFLQEVSEDRHKGLRSQYGGIIRSLVFLSIFFVTYVLLSEVKSELPQIERITPYIGLIAFTAGNIVLVRTLRLAVLQYLFLGSMKSGVPLLIVNIFSLLLSIVLAFWGVSHIFNIQLAPLLATSAAFSIILGLALQDTLGNLFAGISLQVDKSFEIGNWLEVVNGAQKAVGQVKEITWRSTTLIGFSDEIITIPNRIMAQAQISNFSPAEQPIVRSQTFRLPFDCDLEKAEDILERAAAEIGEIRGIPAPFAFISETNEHWVTIKLIYFIDNFGSQFSIGDKIQRKGIEALKQNGYKLAHPTLEIYTKNYEN